MGPSMTNQSPLTNRKKEKEKEKEKEIDKNTVTELERREKREFTAISLFDIYI